MSILLLALTALAAEPPAAVPVTDPAAESAETAETAEPAEPGETAQPDAEAPPLTPEAAEALDKLQTELEEPVDDSAATGWSYYDGKMAGVAEARLATGYAAHGAAGLAAGLVCGGCGCVGAPAVELLVSPGVPQGAWQAQDTAYQRGYIDGYRTEMRKRRAYYALAGGAIGASVAFGTGFAIGVYTGEFPFFF